MMNCVLKWIMEINYKGLILIIIMFDLFCDVMIFKSVRSVLKII